MVVKRINIPIKNVTFNAYNKKGSRVKIKIFDKIFKIKKVNIIAFKLIIITFKAFGAYRINKIKKI